jgi:bifunctional non-homologous end joining protein LigD
VSSERVTVDIDGKHLTLTNLSKVLYPEVGFTKGQVIDYYTRIAPVLLPHLANRPLTMKRYPDGVDGKFFYEKNAPKHRPDWLVTARLPVPGSSKDRETIDYPIVDGLAALVWVANLGSLELHTPMWRVDFHGSKVGALPPDLIVVDLDPGPGAGIRECCQVAQLVRDDTETSVGAGDWHAKTSGSKGLQVYAPAAEGQSSDDTRAAMRELAERLEASHPTLVVSKMTKALRPRKVLVDWSQNNASKTTVSVYSLRARPQPTVSTPVSWDEVDDCADGGDPLILTSDDVLARVAESGDLFVPTS